MNEIAQFIADNKVLQAIAIAVSVGTLAVFLYKNGKSFGRYAIDIVKLGRQKAFIKLNRKVIRMAKVDSLDSSLLVTSLATISLRVVLRFMTGIFIIVPMILFISIGIIKTEEDIFRIPEWHELALMILGFPMGAAFAWYIMRPVFELVYYLHWGRKFALRRIHVEMLKK